MSTLVKRGMGITAIALSLLLVWLTYAFYNQEFTRTVDVTLETSHIGLQLNPRSDVKLRGIIVGSVRDISTNGDGAKVVLALKPSMTRMIPDNVSARILPKTLFGEKFVSLVPPDHPDRPIRARDVIKRDDTTVGIEVEKVLNDALPLLTALDPADLNATLNALATALEGRGEELGRTLTELDGYLKKLNPHMSTAIEDLRRLVTVSNVYSGVADDVVKVLQDSVLTGNTIVDKQQQLQRFFADVTDMSDQANSVLEHNEDRLIRLGTVSRPVIHLLEWYAPMIRCTLQVQADTLPSLNETFRNGALHINLKIISNQPTPYSPSELPKYGEHWAWTGKARKCASRNFAYDGYPGPYTADNPSPLVKTNDGVKGAHHKVPDNQQVPADHPSNGDIPASDSNSSGGAAGPASMGYSGTAAEQRMVNSIVGPAMGVRAEDVPSIATLMFGPLARGGQVSMG
jgi:phospholipid/cholesterol/gamma-HCH transport system substrate-binding protein